MKSRSGNFINNKLGYKTFSPTLLFEVEKHIKIDSLYHLLDTANNVLGELRAISTLLPNADLLIGQYAFMEALLSSKIEGTQSTLTEVMMSKDTIDVREVLNCNNALIYAVKQIKSENGLPLSSRLLMEVHNKLMYNVRGGEKSNTPGEYRTSQNWIGPSYCRSPQGATFVPPPPTDLAGLLSDLEKYIHYGKLPHLIKASLIHYQFETIHPFLDGNGRVGRSLITLYLIDNKMLDAPLLFLSLYFKQNQSKYYDLLMTVRTKGKYEEWIKFFLDGVIYTSKMVMETTNKIQSLQLKCDKGIKHKNELNLLRFLFKTPIIGIRDVVEHLKVNNSTARALIARLEEREILVELGSRTRNKIFVFSEYINIIESCGGVV
ncbi:MAG: Fic family protein [Alphaproteobacteria bacterium]|nr:Fic family protein [Alphaproteobacteria bacterium]